MPQSLLQYVPPVTNNVRSLRPYLRRRPHASWRVGMRVRYKQRPPCHLLVPQRPQTMMRL